MSGALQGVRVLDFGQYLAGPLAALLLADNGAEVVRVDPPGGPRWRHAANAVLQRGKRSIVLDLAREDDWAIARRLIASADVVVENFRPGVMERLGVGPRAMTEANPRLIYCSIPGFAEDDPRAGLAGWEGVVSAAAGLYYPRMPGPPEEPIYNAVPLASSYAAFIAGHSIVAALIARHRFGRGQRIEAPIFDAAFQVMGSNAQIINGKPSVRQSLRTNRAVIRRHQCGDGRYIDISPPLRAFGWLAERFLPKEVNEAGVTDIFNTDPEAFTQLQDLLSNLFKTRTAAEWERKVNDEAGATAALCQTTEEWLHDEHARESRCVISLADPELGPTLQAGYPVALSRTPPEAQGARHVLDADRQGLLAELEARPHPNSLPEGEGGGAVHRALEGFRVVDTSQILAGPTACRILAEHGAEVIKINNPRPENPLGATAHTYVNNGKRTVLLDLKSVEGRELLWRLVEKADVFHQNFVLGVPDRLGIGEADVRAHRPDIVYSSVNTHACGGFRQGWRGHEELGQAVTGMEVRFGGDGQPERAGWPACDYGTGQLSAFAIVLALYHRLRTGEGQHVRASLSGTGTYLQIPFMVSYRGRVWDEPRGQQAKGWGPLYRLYKAQDRWFFLAALTRPCRTRHHGWRKIAPFQSTPTLSQRERMAERLASVEGLGEIGGATEDQLASGLSVRFAEAPAAVWVSRLMAAGLSAQIALDVQENITDPVVVRRGLSILRDHPGEGEIYNVGKAARLSLTPVDPLFPAPAMGWHTREVVEQAGLADRYDDLVATGAVAERMAEGAPVVDWHR